MSEHDPATDHDSPEAEHEADVAEERARSRRHRAIIIGAVALGGVVVIGGSILIANGINRVTSGITADSSIPAITSTQESSPAATTTAASTTTGWPPTSTETTTQTTVTTTQSPQTTYAPATTNNPPQQAPNVPSGSKIAPNLSVAHPGDCGVDENKDLLGFTAPRCDAGQIHFGTTEATGVCQVVGMWVTARINPNQPSNVWDSVFVPDSSSSSGYVQGYLPDAMARAGVLPACPVDGPENPAQAPPTSNRPN